MDVEQSTDTSPYKLQAFQEVGDIPQIFMFWLVFLDKFREILPLIDSAKQGRN